MKNFWSIVSFVAKVLTLAVASFAGASLSGCCCFPQFIF